MMKITQLIANLKPWQSMFVAFMFLFSFSINSQNVGDDLMAATNGALSTEQVTGSGTGCAPCGWTATNGTNYAPTNGNHGPVHSPDRMWKMFANNSGNGEFVAQEFSQLPLGTYTLTFYHRWTNCGNLDYSNGGPALSFKKADGSGGWANVNDPIEVPQSNCGANADWTEMSVTYEVTEVNDYRMQIYKNGANGLNASLHLDTFSFVYTAAAATSDCSFTLQLRDTYGDTWNGNTIDLLVNDVIVGNYTQDASGSDFVSVATAEVSFGDVVSVSYNYSGSYPGENQWQMVDADGAVVSSGNYYDGNGDPVTCTDPTAINLAASATTDGGSATFTFDIANFTVGEAGSGADGHIHYSLNGGSTVMIYSSDALTLSDLPNGDHTIVFSLVDESHQPLDPAVEATVEFSTFDGTAECDETVTYTQVANGDYTVSVTAPEGQAASVTVNATMENGWDFLYVTDGAGNALNADQTTGSFADATYTSTDGTISVNVTNDGSVQNGDVTLAFTCAVPQTAVTFTVNTANIEVGENGMYVGGGVIGNAMAYMMTDDDADGTYEVTVNLDQGTTGNYIFLNSPANGDDWGAKEVLDGQECADANNWNDRLLPEITGDAMTLQHCFGSCETDGTCPVPPVTSNVTFSVDASNYPGGLGESDVVYLNGNFNGWCGDCNPMSDDDGDGIWTITMELADGDYEYKFTVNGWNSQEEFGDIGAVEGCTVSDGTYTNRALTVAGEDMTLATVYWNLCPGEMPSSDAALMLQGIMDFTVPEGGSAGKAAHLYANEDIADLSVYSVQMYSNGGTTASATTQLPALAVTAGQHILIARDVEAMEAYLNASVTFDHVIDGGSFPSGNGDDVVELVMDGSGIEAYGVIGVDGDNEAWNADGYFDYTDTWAYKVDGAWTAAPQDSSDGSTTTCDASEPYPAVDCTNWPGQTDTSDVTFSVDTANYPGGLGESDVVYLNGNFNGWCGDCNPMSDDDGDGIWTITMELADGDYEYKFTVNGWNSQEEFSEVVEGCTISDGTYTNRALTVAGEDMVLPTVYWNLCAGETPGEVYNVTFNLDATGIEVGANGMYMGGGILGGANAVAMSDDDGDGVWTVTIEISTDQIGGNYTFLNSPNDGGDWGAKEDISGQECADADNYNDRIVPEFSGDAEFCYVFAVCTDGVCAEEPVTFPICEDFEGEDGAAGWTFIDAGGATSDWLLDTPANTGDQSIGHGYLPSDVAYNDWAVSPSYNTSGLAEGTATVSYYEYLNWSADAQAHNVYYTLDYAGDATTATWVLLTDVIGTDAEDVFVQRTFNIPSAESVVIGFQYLNTYGADWNIDDVCVDGTLSTTDTEILDMRIYPNPVNGNYVTIQSPIQGLKEVEVYTVTGRKVLQTVLTDDRLDVSSFNSGFYMVKVTINGQSKLSKLVVR
jgi:hypothetical protein